MKDIQSLADTRNINIKKVGVKGVSYPITLSDRSKRQQHTIAEVDMYVNLPHHFKGTHMSRFLEVLDGFYDDFDLRDFPNILRQVKERLHAEASHIDLRFPYFFPRSCNELCQQQVGYNCRLYGKFEERAYFLLTVEIPLEKGMRLEVSVRFYRFFWLEDVIEYAEESISCEYRNVEHTKITEERLCRAVGKRFEGIKELEWFSITVYNDTGFCSTFARTKGDIQ